MDILDFWNQVDDWENFEIAHNEHQKYIFCFLYLSPDSFSVDLVKLENFYYKISKKNKSYKAEEMVEMLKEVHGKLTLMKEDMDPDVSVDFEYKQQVILRYI